MNIFLNIYYVVCIIWFLVFLGVIFNLLLTYTAVPSKFKEKICTKIPSSLNPGELSTLMYKKITPDVFTATIMFLIKKGVLKLRKKKDEFVIVLNTNDIKLSPSQKMVVNILINDIGNGKQVTSEQIKNYCKSNSNCSQFLMNYNVWKQMITRESNKKRFYIEKLEYMQVKTLRNSGIILFLMNILFRFNTLLGYLIIIPSFLIILYFYKVYKRTTKYEEEYHKWISFKRYLNNIEKYDYKKEDIESYIIYGLVLKMPDLEKKLTDFHYVEKLNSMINHNIIISSLKRRFK